MPPRIALVNDHRWIDPEMTNEYTRNILTKDACLSVALVIDGEVTHAVRKRARAGEFRVQDDHGGSVAREPVERSLAQAAEKVVAAAPLTPLYARVDLVETADGPRLMELEVIEPELFFRHHEAAAARLAAALLRELP